MRIALFLIFASIFIGCEKDEVPTIEGKWDVDKMTYKEFYGGQQTFTHDYELTGESMEFKADGQVEVIDQSGTRTGPYTITGETISFLNMTYQIQNLGENSVTLLDHHVHGVGEYHDTFLYLRR